MINQIEESDQTDDDILKEANENIASWFSYWEDNIKRAEKSLEFYNGTQWKEEEEDDFRRKGKELLTYNKLRSYVKQGIGEYRQNTPDVKVRARDLNTEQDETDNVEGLLRAISYKSNADIAYQIGFENILLRGFGGLRIYTQYEDNNSFNQELMLNPVEDPTKMFFDPAAKKPAKDDGNYCGVYATFTEKEFKIKYPNVEYPESFDTYNKMGFEWGNDNIIIVCEYFRKEWFKETHVLLANGETMEKNEYGKLPPQFQLRIISTREVDDYKIMQYKMIANTVLEKTEWASEYFPVVYIDGDSIIHEDAQYTVPFLHPAIDAQRFLNYAISETANFLKISHRGKYILTHDQIANMTDKERENWITPDRAALLVADPDKKTGQMPSPMPIPQMPPDLINVWASADNNIESILGRYGTIKGMDSNAISGRAEAYKIRQGNTTLISLLDNINRAIEHGNRAMVGMFPKIYDSSRLIQIRKADKSQKTIRINSPQLTPTGIQQQQFAQGKFDVEITVGPNFAMQKAEATQQLLTLAASNPQLANLIPDLIVANLDLENVNQIVDRVKTLVPQEILAKEAGQPMPPQQQQPDPQMMLEQAKIKSEMVKAEAEQESAKAKMVDAQRRSVEAGLGTQIAHTRAAAEIGKAQIEYKASLAKAIHSSKEEMLRRENELLRSELARNRPLAQMVG